MIVKLAIIAVALAGAAFFAGTETAVVQLFRRRDSLHGVPDSIRRWLDNPGEFLSVTLIGTNICIITASSVSASLFIRNFGKAGGIYSLLTISIISLILCEVLPKSRALSGPESFARFSAAPLNIVGVVLRPVSRITEALSKFVIKIVHRLVESPGAPCWEELEEVTRRGRLELGDSHKDLMLLMFELSKKRAFDIMVPRKFLPVISTDQEEPPDFFGDSRAFDKIIVETPDGDFAGVVDRTAAVSGPDISANLREPYFVPEQAPVLKLAAEMIGPELDMALVVDEHGNVTGAVDREDL